MSERTEDGNRQMARALRNASEDDVIFEEEDPANCQNRKRAAALRDKLRIIADNLDKHHRGVTIASLSGGAGTIAGSVVAIVGAALIPVTFGASTILLAVGGAVSASGGGTTIGARIFKAINEKRCRERRSGHRQCQLPASCGEHQKICAGPSSSLPLVD